MCQLCFTILKTTLKFLTLFIEIKKVFETDKLRKYNYIETFYNVLFNF